jgi:hypothetical protein
MQEHRSQNGTTKAARGRWLAGPLALVAALTFSLGPGSALAAPPKPKPKPVAKAGVSDLSIVKRIDSPTSHLS